MDADLHGADGTIHQPRDFLVLETLQPGENEHLAVFQGQAGEGGAEEREIVGIRGALGGVGRGIGVVLQVGRIGGRGSVGVLAVEIGRASCRERVSLVV